MNTVEMLDELQNKALHDERLKYRFLKTKEEEDALGAFCRVCRELGKKVGDFFEIGVGKPYKIRAEDSEKLLYY